MTRRTRTILVLLFLFVILTFLRETGRLNVCYFSRNTNTHIDNYWTDGTYIVKATTADPEKRPCFTKNGFREMPLQVSCYGFTYGEEGTKQCPPMIVTIEDVEHGTMWIPLYKSFSFNSKVRVSGMLKAYRREGDNLQLYDYSIHGIIELEGKLTIKGICSYYSARQELAQGLMRDVYDIVRQKIDEGEIGEINKSEG